MSQDVNLKFRYRNAEKIIVKEEKTCYKHAVARQVKLISHQKYLTSDEN